MQELAEAAGVPTSSTSLSFVAALRALKLERVAIAATYPEPVTACFVKLLGDAGFEVVGVESHDIPTAVGAGQVRADALEAMVRAGDRPQAEAVLVPDTALHTVRELPRLEDVIGKPILSANQVTVWDGLRLLGAIPGEGDGTRLFARA